MSDIFSTPIRAITARHSLFPASHTRIPIGVPCGPLCPEGREYGLTVFRVDDTWEVRCRHFPGGAFVLALEPENPKTNPLTFWFMPISIFGMVQFTRFTVDSLTFTLLPKPSSLLRDARGFASPRGVCFTLAGSGYFVEAASDIAVASDARAPRLPPKERRVLSRGNRASSKTITHTASRRTSRNWILPPGTRRISVENRSESSPSLRHFRVCSLPAT